jgi:hypothetical protein
MTVHDQEIEAYLSQYVSEIAESPDVLETVTEDIDPDEDDIPMPMEPQDETVLDPQYPDPLGMEDDMDDVPGVKEYLESIQAEISKNDTQLDEERLEKSCPPCSCLTPIN